MSDSASSTLFSAPTYSPCVLDWDSLSANTSAVEGFVLSNNGTNAPVVSSEIRSMMQSYIDQFANDQIDCGFCIVDLTSGKGLSYNIDERIYGASSMKAHAVIYACQRQVDEGLLDFGSIEYSASSAIIDSDDDAYLLLKSIANCYSQDMYDWLDAMNLEHYLADDTDYPRYTVRDAMKLWTNAYLYLQQSSETVDQLKEWLGSTNTSFIRDGIAQTNLGGTMTVMNKAGWITDWDPECNAIVDAGIVTDGDRSYLMAVMSNGSDSDDNRQVVTNICAALWSAKAILQ